MSSLRASSTPPHLTVFLVQKGLRLCVCLNVCYNLELVSQGFCCAFCFVLFHCLHSLLQTFTVYKPFPLTRTQQPPPPSHLILGQPSSWSVKVFFLLLNFKNKTTLAIGCWKATCSCVEELNSHNIHYLRSTFLLLPTHYSAPHAVVRA